MAEEHDPLQPKRRKGVDTSRRRQVDRDHKRARRAAQEEAQRIDLPRAILEDTKASIYNDCRQALSNDEMSEKICCVCDRLCKRDLLVQKALARGEKFQSAMKDRLRPPADLPTSLRKAYSAAHVDSSLDGMLLSSEGIFMCRKGNVWLRICKACHSSLSNTRTKSPPKFAIANGLFFGALPAEFEDSTPTENAMLNLGQPTHYISAVRGGAHSTLRSHAYVFRSRPESPATMVPADVLRLGAFKVRMVGALTPRQKYQTMRRYQVRTARLQTQLAWYQQNNVLYQNDAIRVNDELLQRETCVVVDQTNESGDQQLYASQLDEATQRFNAPEPAHILSTGDEEGECEEQRTVSVLTDFPRPTETEDIRQALGDPDVIVHRSSDIMSDFSPAFWTVSFCDLYPFGRGGLEEPRKVPIGLHEYLKYCLSVSSRRFAKHYSFLLVAFDVLARHRAMNAIQLTTRLSPHIAGGVASLQRRDLEAHLKEQERSIEAARTGVATQPSEECRALDSGLNAGLRAYWGSNQEKASTRTELFSLSAAFGQPSIFFTFSPSTSSAIRIANLAGTVPDEVAESWDASVNEPFHFSRSKLGQIASQCPIICARYFDRLVSVIIDKILGWDVTAGGPYSQGGIFGQVRAFHAVTESQNSTGDLHAHMLVWVDGLPASVDEYYDCWANEAFRTAALAYTESIVTNTLPHMPHSCPACNEKTLVAVPLTQAAYKKPSYRSRSFPTSECTSCSAQFGGDELLQKHISNRATEMGIDANVISDESVYRQIASINPLVMPSRRDNIDSLMFTRALLTYQHHHWYHSKSCFKPSCRIPKGDTCRMFFPKEVHEQPQATSEGRVVIERPLGHEYIVGHSPTFAALFKLNHDIKLLGAGEGLEKGHYMMKYSTKDQEQVEHRALIYLNAYDKAAQKFADPNDAVSTGTKRILSMMATITSAQEVTATQAGLFIEHESLSYASHQYVKLHMKTFMQALDDEACSLVLREGDTPQVFEATSAYHDYIFRPQDLDGICVADFSVQYEKRRGLTGLALPRSHKHHSTHSIYRRTVPTCITPTGGRLPNAEDENLPPEKRLYYVKFLMIMFKPFRSRSDLLSTSSEWKEAFDSWWSTDEASVAKQYNTFALDHYRARHHARAQPDNDVEHFNSLDAGGGFMAETLQGEETDSDTDDESGVHFQVDSEEVVMEEAPPNHACLLKNYNEAMDLASSASSAHSGTVQTNADVAQLRRELEQMTDNSATTQPPDIQSVDDPASVNTRVSVLAGMDLNPPWQPIMSRQQAQVGPPPKYAQLRTISELHGLNERQHKMFVLAGSALLRDFQSEEGCRPVRQDSEQFRGFLAGLPGAGKSQVIKALQDLASSWERPNAVKTMAFQGVAAQAANGETIHKCFGWRLNGIDDNWRPNAAQEQAFAAVKLIIIDEISTTDAKFIGQIDICLRKIRRSDAILGGIHTMFVGDWLQQLPVAGKAAFEEQPTPRARQQESAACLHQLRGTFVYQQMTTVVILTETMRHRDDPTWAAILDRWRFGMYTHEDMNLVNSTCHHREWSLQPSETADTFCPIVVCSNQLRYEFNQEAFRRHCTRTNMQWHRFPAQLSRTRGTISDTQKESLKSIRDDKTANLPIVLDVSIGMPVQCTKNISKELRLANGTIGHVHDILPARAAHVVRKVDAVSNYPICVYSEPPDAILVKLRGHEKHQFLPSLQPGVVPIFPHLQRGVSVQLPNRQFSVNITQIPLIPAFSITADKSQGLTVNQMILGPLKHSTRSRPQRAAHYVATTRVRSVNRLLLMEPLQGDALAYFHPSPAVIQEVERLEQLSLQ